MSEMATCIESTTRRHPENPRSVNRWLESIRRDHVEQRSV